MKIRKPFVRNVVALLVVGVIQFLILSVAFACAIDAARFVLSLAGVWFLSDRIYKTFVPRVERLLTPNAEGED